MNDTQQEAIAAIERAKSTLMKDGWCKGNTTNKQGEHCLYGSIFADKILFTPYVDGTIPATRGSSVFYKVDAAFKTVARERGSSNPVYWNDDQATGLNDVLDFLDESALVIKENA